MVRVVAGCDDCQGEREPPGGSLEEGGRPLQAAEDVEERVHSEGSGGEAEGGRERLQVPHGFVEAEHDRLPQA